MDEYKESYLSLFNGVTDAIEAMKRGDYAAAEALLVQAQIKAEEAFIRGKKTTKKENYERSRTV